MKYLYYSLYQFYTKIIRVQNHFPPIFNITGVIAILESFIIFAIVDTLIFESTGKMLIPYSPFIPTIIFIGLYWLNYKYYKDKEEELIKDVDKFTIFQKMLMYIFTLGLTVLLIWGYLFSGFYKLLFM